MQLHKPPNRFTPEFQIYKKYKNWEIRRQVNLPGQRSTVSPPTSFSTPDDSPAIRIHMTCCTLYLLDHAPQCTSAWCTRYHIPYIVTSSCTQVPAAPHG
jgi:hypothetical protein